MKFKEKNWSIELSNELNNIEIHQLDDDGEVEIDINGFDCSVSFILTQENIQQLITHLQKQLK